MHHVFRIFILGPFERRCRGGKRRANPPLRRSGNSPQEFRYKGRGLSDHLWHCFDCPYPFFTPSGIFSNRHIHQVHVYAALQQINAFDLVIGSFSFFIDLESSGRISSQVQQQCIHLHRHKPACLFSFSYLRLSSKHPQIPAEFWIIWLYRSLYG
jgi:hypothetical protein